MKRHLLFLMHSLRFGGAERQTAELISRLDPERFSASICCFGGEEKDEVAMDAPSLRRVSRLGKKGKFDLGLLRRLAEVMAVERPDVAICVNPYPLPFVHAIRAVTGRRHAIVPVMHSTLFHGRYTEFLMRSVFVPLANRSDAVVFVCDTQRRHWVDTLGADYRRTRVIANGIDVDRFTPRLSEEERRALRSGLGFGAESFVLCQCAAFRPEKRQHDLVASAASIRRRGVDVRVLLVGDGSERERIERNIRNWGMEEFVSCVGYRSDVRPYLEAADVAVNCSEAESFSLSVLEAMSLGKPMVCTDVGGTREQVREGVNGFLVAPGEVETLAERLSRMLDPHVRQRFGAASRSMAASSFGIQSMVESYQRLFAELS